VRPDLAMVTLQEAGIPAGVARLRMDLASDPHLTQAGHWQPVVRPFMGPHLVPSVAYRWGDRALPYKIEHLAPTLGQHNQGFFAACSASAIERSNNSPPPASAMSRHRRKASPGLPARSATGLGCARRIPSHGIQARKLSTPVVWLSAHLRLSKPWTTIKPRTGPGVGWRQIIHSNAWTSNNFKKNQFQGGMRCAN
jgi:hypothetical protein